MKAPVPPELKASAREAWRHLIRPDNPMPAGVALDWVRERADTDHVRAVKRALFGAAADWLDGLLPYPSGRNRETYSAEVMGAIRTGALARAARQAEKLRDGCYSLAVPVHAGWAKWCDEGAFPALELCRQIEAA